jgi:hypothetical protein
MATSSLTTGRGRPISNAPLCSMSMGNPRVAAWRRSGLAAGALDCGQVGDGVRTRLDGAGTAHVCRGSRGLGSDAGTSRRTDGRPAFARSRIVACISAMVTRVFGTATCAERPQRSSPTALRTRDSVPSCAVPCPSVSLSVREFHGRKTDKRSEARPPRSVIRPLTCTYVVAAPRSNGSTWDATTCSSRRPKPLAVSPPKPQYVPYPILVACPCRGWARSSRPHA